MLTLEESQELENLMLGNKEYASQFSNTAFSGWTFKDFVDALGAKYESKDVMKIGQALLEHRVMHNVDDSGDFTLSGKYRLISQETDQIQALHMTLGSLISQAKFQGQVIAKSSWLFGLINSETPAYAVLNASKLLLFRSLSAASEPFLEYLVSDMVEMKECPDCKQDWYCFEVKMRKGNTLTLCADHSKRQEGWMSALGDLGVNLKKIYEAGDEEIDKHISLFEFSARRLNSKEVVNFSDFKGKVCLVVNVSSLCGLTPQYKELQVLFDKYKDQGFRIIAFPVNQFGNQEPGKEDEIVTFCSTKYHVTFDLFEKTDCNGSNAHPVFRFVKRKLGGVFGTSVKWNFTKFLCDANGLPVKRYAPITTPMSFENDIVELLQQAKSS